jgi:hypothetical protein
MRNEPWNNHQIEAASLNAIPNQDRGYAVKAHYEIVEHDGGWAYRLQGTFSETFPAKAAAEVAANRAAAEQRLPGNAARELQNCSRPHEEELRALDPRHY